MDSLSPTTWPGLVGERPTHARNTRPPCHGTMMTSQLPTDSRLIAIVLGELNMQNAVTTVLTDQTNNIPVG